jgi:hypothetical protein
MSNTYDVTTPLGRKAVESLAEVTAFIGEYMHEPGASLSMVEVSRRLRSAPGPGDLCIPADFWPGTHGP